ncbi:MAG: phosphomethylpyrimidine synthase ThiC [Bacillota bacterium]
MTQRIAALAGNMTEEMRRAAQREGLNPEIILEGLARGTICLPRNINHHSLDPCAIGEGLRTKVNANIGASGASRDTEQELVKLRVAVDAGADAVMDLSSGDGVAIDPCRQAILKESTVPVGTVPIYQAAMEAVEKRGAIIKMTADDLFGVIEKQCQDGVDFITVHCGITRGSIQRLRDEGRIVDVVSRGGAFLTGWILYNERENPLFEQYDRLLEIARRYDVTLSLGDGFRPGCLADASDRGQLQELLILGELVDRAWAAGVQAMVEGPGHVPYDQIESNIKIQKRVCHGAPFYVLGPLVTDVAPGYDHITSAIGGTLAAAAGADFLCYVTPAEHLGLPSLDDVREGVIACRIAGHAADIVKKVKGAWEWDLEMARARKALNWDKQIALSIDPQKALRYRQEKNPEGLEECTMCGKYCAMKFVGEYLGKEVTSC